MLHDSEKKELVIICNACAPVPSATGLLALNCADCLKEYYNIRIIAAGDRNFGSCEVIEDAFTLYTIRNWRLAVFHWLQAKLKTNESTERKPKVLYSILYSIIRLIGKIDRTFFHIDSYKWFERKAYRVLRKMDKDRKIDVIISVSEPVRSHIVAKKFKEREKNTRWVCYWGDLYATKYFRSNIFQSQSDMNRLEKDLVSKADYILCNEEIYYHYSKLCDSNKISSIPYSLKNEILLATPPVSRNEPKVAVYFGSFSQTMRNPEFLLQLFVKSPYRLELYSSGCESVIQKYIDQSHGNIVSYGFVEPAKLREKVFAADLLINMGNYDSSFIPSKTLELLSYRKPILDIYYGDNDKTPISKYPYLLRVSNNDSIEESLKRIDSFLAQRMSAISVSDLKTMFSSHTKENVKKIILEAVKQDD